MRYLLLSSALLLAGGALAARAEEPKRTVYLDSVVLEEIKQSNPDRYAHIRGVMAQARQMCKPNAARTWALGNTPAGDCSSLVLKTSYPPKRQITFSIEDTLYIANVVVLDAPALVKADPGKLTPLHERQQSK
jgi:hypothetical protein